MNLVFLATGAVMTLVSDATQELGIAVVVGSIFALSSIGLALWAHLFERDQYFWDKLVRDDLLEEYRERFGGYLTLQKRILLLEREADSS